MTCNGNPYGNADILPPESAFNGAVRLSLAAPAYNEATGIRDVLESWLTFLRNEPLVSEFEIVVCNDGSHDGTGAVIDSLASSNSEVRTIHFLQNQGAAVALTAAIAVTSLDWVLLLDSDGQFPIENFLQMLAAVRRDRSPAAIGIRRKKDVWFARFGTWSSGFLCNLVHGVHIRDFNSAFKLTWGALLRSIPLEARGMNYSTEITSRLLECGINLAEVEIDHRPRITGKSSMKLLRGAVHRLLFVLYIAFRQVLLRHGILNRRFKVFQ